MSLARKLLPRSSVARWMLAVAVLALLLAGLGVRRGEQSGASWDAGRLRFGVFRDSSRRNFRGSVGMGDFRSGYWEWSVYPAQRWCVFVGWRNAKGETV